MTEEIQPRYEGFVYCGTKVDTRRFYRDAVISTVVGTPILGRDANNIMSAVPGSRVTDVDDLRFEPFSMAPEKLNPKTYVDELQRLVRERVAERSKKVTGDAA